MLVVVLQDRSKAIWKTASGKFYLNWLIAQTSVQLPFISLNAESFSWRSFTSADNIKKIFDSFLAWKDNESYRNEMHMLPEKREKVITDDD